MRHSWPSLGTFKMEENSQHDFLVDNSLERAGAVCSPRWNEASKRVSPSDTLAWVPAGVLLGQVQRKEQREKEIYG